MIIKILNKIVDYYLELGEFASRPYGDCYGYDYDKKARSVLDTVYWTLCVLTFPLFVLLFVFVIVEFVLMAPVKLIQVAYYIVKGRNYK